MGLIGGGEGAFIGAVHRMAEVDGRIAMTSGAYSSDPAKSRAVVTKRRDALRAERGHPMGGHYHLFYIFPNTCPGSGQSPGPRLERRPVSACRQWTRRIRKSI